MVRTNYKKYLLKNGRSTIELTLLFPGVLTFFPIFAGIMLKIVSDQTNDVQSRESFTMIPEAVFIFILFITAVALRWKLFSLSYLLAPMKPNKKPYIRTSMEEVPENPNEVMALLALERFKSGTFIIRAILAVAGLTLTIMISQKPDWVMMGPAILLILLYVKFLAPRLLQLEQAIDEISYKQVSESIDMKDFLPSHIADLDKFQDFYDPEEAEIPIIPDMPESLPEAELKNLQDKGDLNGLARFAWLDLSRSKSKCRAYDYFPHGGIQNFYCHLKTYCSYAFLAKTAGMPVFISGPHSPDRLDLKSESDFGHYNPEFVQWLLEWTIPALNDSAFRRLTQPVYDYFVQSLARTYFIVYNKWVHNPDLLKKEIDQYLMRIKEKIYPSCDYQKYYYFLNPSFKFQEETTESEYSDYDDNDEYDGNVVNTAAAFWIRRFLDGTAEDFYRGLTALIEIYDTDYTKTAKLKSRLNS